MQSAEKIEMSRFRFLTTIFIAMLALLTGVSVTAATSEELRALAKKYEPMMAAQALEEDKAQAIRVKIAELSKSEISEFMTVGAVWLDGSFDQHQSAILSFDLLRKNKAFDKPLALQMLKLLKEARVDRPIKNVKSVDSIVEKRMYLFLAVKAGLLNSARVDAELKLIADAKRDSVERVGMAGALVDAMAEAGGMKPTVHQLEKLLKNDISDIRILAVDWFQFSPPADVAERTRFLKAALKTNPRQVSESAQRACAADASPVVRDTCAKVKVAADSP